MTPDTSIPELTSLKLVDPITGEPSVRYFWKDKPVPQVRITGRLAEILGGYTLIAKDLENARRWLRRAQAMIPVDHFGEDVTYVRNEDRETFDLVKALFVAAVTFYGKAYADARGRRARLERDWLDATYRDTHDYFMGLRHNFAAHSGDARVEIAQTFVLLHPSKPVSPMLATIRVQPDLALPKPGDTGLDDLIQHALKKLQERHDRLARKLLDAKIIPRGNDSWRRAAEEGLVVPLE